MNNDKLKEGFLRSLALLVEISLIISVDHVTKHESKHRECRLCAIPGMIRDFTNYWLGEIEA